MPTAALHRQARLVKALAAAAARHYGIAMIPLEKPAELMNVDKFLAWDPGDGLIWQLVDGLPMAMAPPSERHGSIQNEMGALIRNHLLAQGSPCRCVATPGIVTPVAADRNMRIPDLAVTCAPPAAVPTVALPDPILVIEVLSPGNQAETWINVWTYTLVPSVQEVLVLHSTAVRADLLRRGPDGAWPTVASPLTEGSLDLDSIGFSTPLASIYRTTSLA